MKNAVKTSGYEAKDTVIGPEGREEPAGRPSRRER
jgi:hypothetical protein